MAVLSKHWTLDDIPWARFDASRVDANIPKMVKAASLVEYNAGDELRHFKLFHDHLRRYRRREPLGLPMRLRRGPGPRR